MATSKKFCLQTYLYSLVLLPVLFLLTSCGGGSSSGGSAGSKIVQVPIIISSGGITVGLNNFNFDPIQSAQLGAEIQSMFAKLPDLLLSTAHAASTTYRVSPDKAKLRLTKFSFIPVETNVDTSVEGAYNLSNICEIVYDKTNPNQSFTCIVELQVGLHYKTIDFSVAPTVDVYINDSTNGIYTTVTGLTTTNPGANLGYFTANFSNNNTNFHAEFPFTINTATLGTTLSKTTTTDKCGNTIETKMTLTDGTVLSDVITTPGTSCATPGTSTTTVNIGTQSLNVVLDMIHGLQVDNNSGSLTINTAVPWWTIVGSFGSGLSVKHYASTASGLTAATYQFPPSVQGINEVKIAYANGVAVAAQMVPNGYNMIGFCRDDYDTPNNSPGNGYVGSDGTGAAWAVGLWSNGRITNYTSEYYLNTTTKVFYCLPISTDPNPSSNQLLNTFTANMPVPNGWRSQQMTRIDR